MSDEVMFGEPSTWNMKVGEFIETQLPKEKPQELLDLQEQNRKQRLLDSLQKLGPGLMDESLDFIRRKELADGTVLDEKTFRELYEKFPGGTDPEFLEFIKKEGEAKGIKYVGSDRGVGTVELTPRSIQNRRQNVLKIPKKGGLPFKLSPQEFRKRAKEYGINVRGLTDEEIRRKVQNRASSLAVKKRFAEDPEYRESKRERLRQTREKFKTNDPEKYRKYLQSVQESRIKSGRMVRVPTEFTPKGYFWGDLVKNAQEFKDGRLKNSHIKYASPNTKIPKKADATNKIKLIDTNVKDPKTGRSKVLTYDNFLKHIDDNQNIYRIDSKTALGEYKKKEFINKNPDLKKGLIKELYDIDIADKDLYEGGALKKGIAPYKRAPFHIHHTAGRGANAFNVQFAVGSDNIEEGRARRIFDTDFKLAKNFGEQKAAVKKYLDSVPENLEVRLKNTPYGTRETLVDMTKRVAPDLFEKQPTAMQELMARTGAGIDPILAAKAGYEEILKPIGKAAVTTGKVLGQPTIAAGIAADELRKGNIKTGGAALLAPELVGSFAPKGRGLLSLAGRIAANPFGKAARAFTPVGLATIGAGALYDVYKEYERRQALTDEERLEEDIERDRAADEMMVGAAEGGRISLKDGPDKKGLKSPSRRNFLKTTGGLAGILALLPFGIGKGIKLTQKAAPVVGEGFKLGMDKLMVLVDKIKLLGKDVTPKYGTKEREKVTLYQGKDGSTYELSEDLSTGDIRVVRDVEGGATVGDESFDTIQDRSEFMITRGRADETTKGKKPPDEYEEGRAVFDQDGTVADVDDVDDAVIEAIEDEIN